MGLELFNVSYIKQENFRKLFNVLLTYTKICSILYLQRGNKDDSKRKEN